MTSPDIFAIIESLGSIDMADADPGIPSRRSTGPIRRACSGTLPTQLAMTTYEALHGDLEQIT
jgi:hypothetical protein